MFVKEGSPVSVVRRPGAAGGPELGALAERVRPTAASRTRLLPIPGPLVPLMPDGGLRRGSVVHCTGEGALSLTLAVLGAASAAGSWCGLVGVGDLGALAAAGYGVDLHRLAVVRAPAAQWAASVARLLEGFDVVAVEPPGRARPQAVRSLVARARRQGAVLVVVGTRSCWPDPADVRLEVHHPRWHGLDRGAGRLEGRRVTVEAHGRGVASRPVARELWLPTDAGRVAPWPSEVRPPAGV
jgi:hypothetical protein